MSRMGFCPKFGAVYCILTKIIRIIVFDNQNAKVKIIESWMGFLSECTTVQSVDEMCRYMKGCVQQWCHGGRPAGKWTEGLDSCDKMWQRGGRKKFHYDVTYNFDKIKHFISIKTLKNVPMICWKKILCTFS